MTVVSERPKPPNHCASARTVRSEVEETSYGVGRFNPNARPPRRIFDASRLAMLLHAHRRASGRATPCHLNSRSSSKNLHRPLRILYNATHGCFPDSGLRILYINSRAQSRAGGWIASFDFGGASTSTPALPTIASTNESLDDSSMITSTLTGAFCCILQCFRISPIVLSPRLRSLHLSLFLWTKRNSEIDHRGAIPIRRAPDKSSILHIPRRVLLEIH